MTIEEVVAGLLIILVIEGLLAVVLTIFDTTERFGDELHDYFEGEDE